MRPNMGDDGGTHTRIKCAIGTVFDYTKLSAESDCESDRFIRQVRVSLDGPTADDTCVISVSDNGTALAANGTMGKDLLACPRRYGGPNRSCGIAQEWAKIDHSRPSVQRSQH